uniref:Chemokine interleukin-8-like domain-containing protein n=1 Tax=Chelydra serpentina TaxID=8475 RepID=A0A8C3SSP6_CHESE
MSRYFNCNLTRNNFHLVVASQITPRSSCVDLSTKQLEIRHLKNINDSLAFLFFPCRFITKDGIKICVQPDLKWVQNAIKFLDKRPNRRPNTNTGTSESIHH